MLHDGSDFEGSHIFPIAWHSLSALRPEVNSLCGSTVVSDKNAPGLIYQPINRLGRKRANPGTGILMIIIPYPSLKLAAIVQSAGKQTR
jgi:hypothetical protein